MKKLIVLVLMVMLVTVSLALPLTSVTDVKGAALHTIQKAWVIIDETTAAGDEPSALDGLHDTSETLGHELTKLKVEILIAAASGGDDEISTFSIPASWNSIRFRSMGVDENDAMTYQIYLGSTGGERDCELIYVGQLVWLSGSQSSTYSQITFTSGGPYIPQIGDVATGESSGETAIVRKVPVAATGTFAAGTANATGTIEYRSRTDTFTNTETINMKDSRGTTHADVLTHAGTDLIGFEMADTVTVTSKSWSSSWTTTSPADDTIAEVQLDVKGADFLVVLVSETSHDVKLLGKGY